MKFCEVIINSSANEVSARIDLPDYISTLRSFIKVGVTDLRRKGLSFLMCAEASIKLFNSSFLMFDFIGYTRDLVHPQR
jgi:hypothetical protein